MRNWLSNGFTIWLIFCQIVCYAQESQIVKSVNVSNYNILISLDLGTRELINVKNGSIDLKYDLDDIQWINATGEPNLPSYVFHVLLPPDVDLSSVSCKFEQSDYQLLTDSYENQILPVPPPVTWIDGKMIEDWPMDKTIHDGKDAAIYERNEFWPEAEAEIKSLSVLRKWKMARIAMPLIRYNPVSDVVEQFYSGKISVNYSLTTNHLSIREKQDHIGINRVRNLCVNFDQMMHEYDVTEDMLKSLDTEITGYAIITTQAIKNNSLELQNFIQHKNSLGYNVILATEQDFGTGIGDAAAENIRAWLQANYLDMNIEYVLLIGNPHFENGEIPLKRLWTKNEDFFTPTTSSDFYFADLTGNWDLDGDGIYGEQDDFGTGGIDFAAEVLIGRIPVYSISAVGILDSILAKIIAYELNNSVDNLRRTCLLSINPVDEITPIYRLGEEIREDFILPANWGYHRIYEEEYDLVPPPETTPTNIKNVVDVWGRRPFGFSILAAHGNSSIAADIMDIDHVEQLSDDYPSMTFQASCSNSYPIDEENLSYTLLKNGAISTLGATGLAWYSLGEASYVNSPTTLGMAYEYAHRIILEGMSQGEALYEIDMILPNNFWWNKTVFTIYGDPSLSIGGCQTPVPVVNDITVNAKDSIPVWIAEGTNIRWYSDSYLTSIAAIGCEFHVNTRTPGIHHYYITQTINECESAPDEATLTILLPPPIIIVKDTSVYMDAQIPELVALGDSVKWYSEYTLSDLVFIGNEFNTGKSLPGVYTYYASQTYYGVESEAQMVILRILIIPPKADDVTVSYGEEIPGLEASGENINWYIEYDLDKIIYDERDIESYKTVKLGKQNWMAENLNYVASEGSWAYNNDESMGQVYGRLYNWETANEVCPAGWKLPSDNDWKELEAFLGMDSSELDSYGYRGTDEGGKLKATGVEHWMTPNIGATNVYGFNALGAGCYWGNFYYLKKSAYYWTSSIYPKYNLGILRRLDNNFSVIGKEPDDKSGGLSVRCIQEIPEPVAQGNVFKPDITKPGTYVYYITQTINGTESQPDTVVLTVIFNPPKSEDVSICEGELPVINAEGENIKWYDVPLNHFIDTRDGQLYRTTEMNGQNWMAENFNYYTSSGSWYYETDSISYSDPYGRLYNWETANEVCPNGWRLPSDNDWKDLEVFLGMDVSELNRFGLRGTDEGGKLKSKGFDHWLPPNEGAINAYGFNAMGAGNCIYSDCSSLKEKAYFWTSTEENINMAILRSLYYSHAYIDRSHGDKIYTTSVRCMQEKPEPIALGNAFYPGKTEAGKYIFYVTQTVNGVESPADSVVLTIHPAPDAPIAFDNVVCEDQDPIILLAEGENIKWYTDLDTLSLVDLRDGQEYLTVKIGTQWWMAENLNYGNRINAETDPANNGQVEKYCYSDMNEMCADYGGLYTWDEAMNYSVSEADQGICPAGWHIPSDKEWRILELYLGMDTAEAYGTGWRGTLEGGKLKDNSPLYWDSPNNGATNEVAFTALPAGTRYLDHTYQNLGSWAYFWTSTHDESENVWKRNLTSFESRIRRQVTSAMETMSVRCVKDNHVLHEGDTLILDKPEPGIYKYNVSQTVNGCESNYQTIELTIKPLPGIPDAEDQAICFGEETPDLSAQGENINWYSDTALTNCIYSGNVFSTTHTEPGTYTYYVTQTIEECEGGFDPVNLFIYSLPDIGLGPDTTITDQQHLVLGTAENEDYSYLWSNGSVESFIEISGNDIGVGDHSYWVVVTDSNSCENSDTVIVSVTHENFTPYSQMNRSIQIYPNPAVDALHVCLHGIDKENLSVKVIDQLGNVLISEQHKTIFGKTDLKIDVSALPRGIYFIRIFGEKIMLTRGIALQ